MNVPPEKPKRVVVGPGDVVEGVAEPVDGDGLASGKRHRGG